MIKAINTAINKISTIFGVLGEVIICILAVLLMWDVFMRFVVNRPVYWILDITQLLQGAMALMAGAYVLKLGGHVNMSAVIAAATRRWKKILTTVHLSVVAICCGFMAYLSWPMFMQSLRIKECPFGITIPLAPWKFLVPLGFALLSLQALAMTLGYVCSPLEDFKEVKGD
jgi:TRAP-type C4-dicarboxylate transport system permease small subunit